jgi:hypothetical protein
MSQIPREGGSRKGKAGRPPHAGSITGAAERVKQGDSQAVARQSHNALPKTIDKQFLLKSRGTPRGIARSDVAQEAMTAFFVAIE